MPAVALFAVLFMSVEDLKMKSRDLAPVESTSSNQQTVVVFYDATLRSK